MKRQASPPNECGINAFTDYDEVIDRKAVAIFYNYAECDEVK